MIPIKKYTGIRNESIPFIRLGKGEWDALRTCRYDSIATNGSGIAEGRDLKDKSFNLAQMPNMTTKD